MRISHFLTLVNDVHDYKNILFPSVMVIISEEIYMRKMVIVGLSSGCLGLKESINERLLSLVPNPVYSDSWLCC